MAPDLIGCLLVGREGSRLRLGRIVETEAYVGEHDLACHAKAGRTARTDPMYGEPGRAYVYFVYGIHHCANVVCGPGGAPNAVLLRAAAPLREEERAARGLGEEELAPLLHSARGPGNLCRAFAVTLRENRADLCSAESAIFLAPRPAGAGGEMVAMPSISRGPRIGVDYAGVWAKEPLRFWEAGDPHVSGHRRAGGRQPKRSAARAATRRRGR